MLYKYDNYNTWNIDSSDFRNIQNNYNINPIDHY